MIARPLEAAEFVAWWKAQDEARGVVAQPTAPEAQLSVAEPDA
jgi:hypothetical protein